MTELPGSLEAKRNQIGIKEVAAQIERVPCAIGRQAPREPERSIGRPKEVDIGLAHAYQEPLERTHFRPGEHPAPVPRDCVLGIPAHHRVKESEGCRGIARAGQRIGAGDSGTWAQGRERSAGTAQPSEDSERDAQRSPHGLDGLEAQGLISRSRESEDRRVITVRISEGDHECLHSWMTPLTS